MCPAIVSVAAKSMNFKNYANYNVVYLMKIL